MVRKLSANGRDISRKHVVPSPELLFMYRCALADSHSQIHKYDRAVRYTLVEVYRARRHRATRDARISKADKRDG